jgi:hypothetical protein
MQYGVGSKHKERNSLMYDTRYTMQDTEICVIASPEGAWQSHLFYHPERPFACTVRNFILYPLSFNLSNRGYPEQSEGSQFFKILRPACLGLRMTGINQEAL